jgi:hypothetical protein
MTIDDLAKALHWACYRQYPQIYNHTGPTLEMSWKNICEEQRNLLRAQAEAAVAFLAAAGWRSP